MNRFAVFIAPTSFRWITRVNTQRTKWKVRGTICPSYVSLVLNWQACAFGRCLEAMPDGENHFKFLLVADVSAFLMLCPRDLRWSEMFGCRGWQIFNQYHPLKINIKATWGHLGSITCTWQAGGGYCRLWFFDLVYRGIKGGIIGRPLRLQTEQSAGPILNVIQIQAKWKGGRLRPRYKSCCLVFGAFRTLK